MKTITKEQKSDALPAMLLKKIKLEVRAGQSLLVLGSALREVVDLLSPHNMIRGIDSFAELKDSDPMLFRRIEKGEKTFSYVIADMDSPEMDDLEGFLDKVAPLIIRPGLLIIIGSNLCTMRNKLLFLIGKAPRNLKRPIRAVPPDYLRDTMLEKGFFVKNRFWDYGQKFLLMADIPVQN